MSKKEGTFKRISIKRGQQETALSADELLTCLLDDYTATKQIELVQLRKGMKLKEDFMTGVREHLILHYSVEDEAADEVITSFEQYIFGYSKLSSLIDDLEISDIRCVGYDNIRIKRKGERQNSSVCFKSEKEYRHFVELVATKNQVNISNVNAIQRFTDTESHPDFILRFTITMPLINTYKEPYLCIRKVPKKFPKIKELVDMEVLDEETAEILKERFRIGSTLICGSNSSGKTTLLNALKESLPDNISVLVAQQADELTTQTHPDMMFLHSLPGTGESQVNYDLKNISIAGLTMDVDFFIVGEVKGDEAMYLLNAACTGQTCAATVHAPDATRAIHKIVDYAMYTSKYGRNELMRMMDCFQTVIYMEKFKVNQVCSIEGWNEDQNEIRYIPVFATNWRAEWTTKYKNAVNEVGKGEKRAITLLEEEAADLNVIACDGLAKLYEMGTVVAPDQRKAQELYHVALKGYLKCLDHGGDMTAYLHERLGVMYYEGKGTEKDREKAYEHINIAVSMGRENASKLLAVWNQSSKGETGHASGKGGDSS